MDFAFASFEEICAELGARLRRQRLAQLITQKELAARAGLSVGTVKTLEATGQSSLDSLVRVVSALGLVDELSGLFVLKTNSIAAMERAERTERLERKRAPRARVSSRTATP